MSIVAGITAGIGAAVGGVGSVLAGDKQADAAGQAAAGEQPWVDAGKADLTTLQSLLGEGLKGEGPLAPWTGSFTEPSLAQAEAQPGYEFQLKAGEDAINNSAAATGDLLNPNTARAESQYAESAATTNYQSTRNNMFQDYQTAYNQYQTNQTNLFNRYFGIADMGQRAVTAQGNFLVDKGTAEASGIAGATNAITGGLGDLSQLAMMKSLLGNTKSSNGTAGLTGNSLSGWGAPGSEFNAGDPNAMGG